MSLWNRANRLALGALLLLGGSGCAAASDESFWNQRDATTIVAGLCVAFNAFALGAAAWTLVRGGRWVIFVATPIALFAIAIACIAIGAHGHLAEPGDLTRRELPVALVGIGPFFWLLAAFIRRFPESQRRIFALILLPIGVVHGFGFVVLAEKAILPTPHGSPLVLLTCAEEQEALFDDGSVWTWSADRHAATPIEVTRVVDLKCGCALDAIGSVHCWDPHETKPKGVEVLNASRIAGTSDRTCALGRDGSVTCWGTAEDSDDPPVVTDAVSIAVAQHHFCAVRRGGLLSCYGIFEEDTAVAALTDVVEVAVGDAYGCARTSTGRLYCWGEGTLGDGSTSPRATTAVPVLAHDVVQVVAGGGHTCVRLTDGTVLCWGESDGGQVGNGATALAPPTTVLRPTRIAVARPAVSLVAGADHTCARSDRTFECWGWNGSDALRTGVHERCSDDLGSTSGGTCTPTPHTVSFVE